MFLRGGIEALGMTLAGPELRWCGKQLIGAIPNKSGGIKPPVVVRDCGYTASRDNVTWLGDHYPLLFEHNKLLATVPETK
jgi:hypothetical protein